MLPNKKTANEMLVSWELSQKKKCRLSKAKPKMPDVVGSLYPSPGNAIAPIPGTATGNGKSPSKDFGVMPCETVNFETSIPCEGAKSWNPQLTSFKTTNALVKQFDPIYTI